jgi:hypothetical protein
MKMKKLKNPSGFFKLLLAGILSIFMSRGFAQPHLCQDPCPPGPLMSKTIDLCKFNWSGTVNGFPDNLTNAPYVFVIINYRLRTCNGVTSVVIEDYVYVDNRDYWINNCFAGSVVQPPIASAIAGNPCLYPDPASANDIKQAVKDAIQLLLADLAIPQSYLDVYFKGACYSMVKLIMPAGSFWAHEPDDLGRRDTTFFSGNTTVQQRIPCNDACCKVTFQIKVITLANGETTYTYKAISYEGDGPSCDMQPLPDYNAYNPKLEATMFDPVTGQTITVNGMFAGQEPCQLTCPQYCYSGPPTAAKTTIATDLASVDAPLEFSASPTLVNNFIRFKSNKPILKILVYDVTGRIVMNSSVLDNSNELNTSELKKGPYFITVYFTGNESKNVKILKL